MRFSDLSPEEQAASWQRTQDTLARVDQTNAELAAREIPEALWQPPAAEPRAAPQPARPPQRTAMAPPAPSKITRPVHDAAGRIVEARTYEGAQAQALGVWEAWVYSAIDRRVGAAVRKWFGEQLEIFAKGVAEVEHEVMTQERAAMRAWVDARIAAALDEERTLARRVVAPSAVQSQVTETTATARGPGFPTGRGEQRNRSAFRDAAD